MSCMIVVSKWVVGEIGSQQMNIPELYEIVDRCRDITSVNSDLIPPSPNINLFLTECGNPENHETVLADSRFFVVCHDGDQENQVSSGFIDSLISYLVGREIHEQVLEDIFFPLVNPTYQEIINELVTRIRIPGSFNLV